VVHAKPPFGSPEQVLAYLGRYTHRVAIANSRLATLDDTQVGFRWKDYRHHGKTKLMTLAADEFIRRFLQHTLPDGFHRIRHYGLLANANRTANLALCRRLLAVPPPASPPPSDYRDRYHQLTGRRLDICPCCGGTMEPIGPLHAPPHTNGLTGTILHEPVVCSALPATVRSCASATIAVTPSLRPPSSRTPSARQIRRHHRPTRVCCVFAGPHPGPRSVRDPYCLG
jgi:hypothetical protein